MFILPKSSTHQTIADLALYNVLRVSNDYEYNKSVKNIKGRHQRRVIYNEYVRRLERDILIRAKLVIFKVEIDSLYENISIEMSITRLGRKALKELDYGLVYDTKLQQSRFSATKEYYLAVLSKNVIRDDVMTTIEQLPARYKEVHKAAFYCRLFYQKDKDTWFKIAVED